MEEKRNERNKKTRTPKMQIDEKMQQEGSKNDEKIEKIRVRGSKNQRNGDRGRLHEATQREVGKNRGSPYF